MRRKTMLVRAALLALVTSCMGEQEAQELALDDERSGPRLEYSHLPDGQRVARAEPPPVPPPAARGPKVAPEVPRGDRPRIEISAADSDSDAELFERRVQAFDFPAIDAAGTTIVMLTFDANDSFSHSDNRFTVIVADASTGAALESMEVWGTTLSRVRRNARRVNRRLRETAWRSLAPLPLAIYHPDYLGDGEERDRFKVPVQIGLSAGQWFVRIPKVRVLEKFAALASDQAYPHRIWGDARTGVVVLSAYDCSDGEDCTCNPRWSTRVVTWSERTFAAIAKRNIDPKDPRCEAEDGEAVDPRCEHAGDIFGPYEMNQVEPPWARTWL